MTQGENHYKYPWILLTPSVRHQHLHWTTWIVSVSAPFAISPSAALINWRDIRKLSMEIQAISVCSVESHSIGMITWDVTRGHARRFVSNVPAVMGWSKISKIWLPIWNSALFPLVKNVNRSLSSWTNSSNTRKLTPRKGKHPHQWLLRNARRTANFIVEFACSHLQLAKSSFCIKLATWKTSELTYQCNLTSTLRMKESILCFEKMLTSSSAIIVSPKWVLIIIFP